MGAMGIGHWILVGAVVLVLFGGRGKVSELMGDFAKGIKSFKKGMAEDETTNVPPATASAEPVRTIDHRAEPIPASTTTLADRKLG